MLEGVEVHMCVYQRSRLVLCHRSGKSPKVHETDKVNNLGRKSAHKPGGLCRRKLQTEFGNRALYLICTQMSIIVVIESPQYT